MSRRLQWRKALNRDKELAREEGKLKEIPKIFETRENVRGRPQPNFYISPPDDFTFKLGFMIFFLIDRKLPTS